MPQYDITPFDLKNGANPFQTRNVLSFMHIHRTFDANNELTLLPKKFEDLVEDLKATTPQNDNVRRFQRSCINIVNNSELADEDKDALIRELTTTPLKLSKRASGLVISYFVAMFVLPLYATDNTDNAFLNKWVNDPLHFYTIALTLTLVIAGAIKLFYKPDNISVSGSQFNEVMINVEKHIHDIIRRDDYKRFRNNATPAVNAINEPLISVRARSTP